LEGGKGTTLGDFSNEASRSCILYSKNSASASYHKNKMLAHSINQVTELGMVKFSDGPNKIRFMFSNCNEPMLQNQFKLGGEIKRWEVVWKQLSVTASLENM